jgi:hypothetical protein
VSSDDAGKIDKKRGGWSSSILRFPTPPPTFSEFCHETA